MVTSDEEQIEQIRRDIERAENEKDAKGLGRHFSDDVTMRPARGPHITGVDAVVDYHRELYTTWDEAEIEFSIGEIDVLGGLAVERGTYAYTIVPADGDEPNTGDGDYLYVYERSADGPWEVLRLSWG